MNETIYTNADGTPRTKHVAELIGERLGYVKPAMPREVATLITRAEFAEQFLESETDASRLTAAIAAVKKLYREER